MKDILDIFKSAVVIVGTLTVILAGIHFGLGQNSNPLHEVPQTHVYTGE